MFSQYTIPASSRDYSQHQRMRLLFAGCQLNSYTYLLKEMCNDVYNFSVYIVLTSLQVQHRQPSPSVSCSGYMMSAISSQQHSKQDQTDLDLYSFHVHTASFPDPTQLPIACSIRKCGKVKYIFYQQLCTMCINLVLLCTNGSRKN